MKMNVNNIPEIEKTLSVRLPKVYVDYMTENSTHNIAIQIISKTQSTT